MSTFQTTLGSLIQLGGPVVLFLMLFSIVGLAVVLLKSWQFLSLRLSSTKFVVSALNLWQRNEQEKAIGVVDGRNHPVAKVLYTAFVHCIAKSGISIENAREETMRVARAQLEKLRSYLRILEVIATLSPLLGLFGTVLGMIKAFRELELAGSRVDPAVLSGGIWEALLTTAVGLAIAIPAVLMVNYFDRVIDRVRYRMEDAATQVFTSSELSHKVRVIESKSSSAA